MICSSQNINAIIPKNITDDIWTDGEFQGIIRIGESNGNITGQINLGRGSTNGVFKATIQIDNETYEAKGWFRKKIIIGLLKKDSIIVPIYGNILLQHSSFNANLIIPHGSIEATYTASYLPPVSGEYGIGVKEYHLIDESREEVLTTNPDDKREFMIKIWYPTNKHIEGEWYEYMSETMFKWLMNRAPIPLISIPKTAYKDVKPHGKVDIAIAENPETFPIVLFSHGLDGTIEIYTSFIEELVSKGYIVITMNHPYVAGVVEFPDSRTIYYENSLWINDPEYANKALRTIIEDAKYTIDYMDILNNSDVIFKGRLDMNHIGMYGHSFGGASTSACCVEDNRINCGLTLDGVFYEEILPDGVNKPFFMMTADNRFNTTGVNYIWEKKDSNIFRMSIYGSTHYGYTDVGLLLSHMLPLIPMELLNFGTVDPKLMTEIVRQFIVKFFNVYLKSEPLQEIINISEEYNEYIQFEYKI
jgi:hypothetical protein